MAYKDRVTPTVPHFTKRVLERSGVEPTPAVIEFIENAYMDADTMADTVKALKNNFK